MKNLVVITLLAILFLFGCAMNKDLHIPAGQGDLTKVRAEIDSGKDVNSKDAAGQTALMYASEMGQLEVVKYLVESGADVNVQSTYDGKSALIWASINDQIAVMEYLLKHGADVNATTKYHNETALMYATVKGHVRAVNLLLENNADTKMKNKEGKTALDMAKQFNRKELALMISER